MTHSYTDDQVAALLAELEELRAERTAEAYREWEEAHRQENERLRQQIAEVQCRYCDGTGDRPTYKDEELSIVELDRSSNCNICSGKGLIRLEIPDTPINCKGCSGTGRQRRYVDWDKPGRRWMEECYHCKGFGIVSLTGYVSQYYGNPNDLLY